MGRLKDLHLKLKAFRLRRFLGGDEKKKKKLRQSWMMPAISHGYHVIVNDDDYGGDRYSSSSSSFGDHNDKIVVQREQIDDENELWFFGVFDTRIADGVTKYMQTHIFHKKFNQSQMRRRSKETMKKAHIYARAKIREKDEKACKVVGSASAIVMNGEKLLIANMGDYKVVVCRDGEAHQINRKNQQQSSSSTKRHWWCSHRFISGVMRMSRVRIKAGGESSDAAAGSKSSSKNSSELVIGSERIDSDTEFVILASTGIWEVMRHQEAVNLIRHIEDPQKAAECLANEAIARMSRSNISCLIIRFD